MCCILIEWELLLIMTALHSGHQKSISTLLMIHYHIHHMLEMISPHSTDCWDKT